MKEDIKNIFKLIGGLLTPLFIAWIWWLLKDKYTELVHSDTSHSKRIRDLENEQNVIKGTLGGFGKNVGKEFLTIKNELTVIASTGNEDIGRLRSEITRIHLEIIELRKFAQRHENALAVAHKLFNRHAADLAHLHKEHQKKLV